jgi:hypothetical protein
MNRITKTVGTSVISLLVLMSFAPITFGASEVQGTLSSDGSSGAAQQPGNAGGATSEQPLSGTVMGGSDEDSRRMSALAGFTDSRTTLGLMSALIPIALLLAAFGFILYRRRSI